MKTLLAAFALLAFNLAALPIDTSADPVREPVIRTAPAAPKFTDVQRRAELTRRRAAVAAKMKDKSMLILFSASAKLYANDVNYVYRQENNLYYLTNLKKYGATLVMIKNGGQVREAIFIPKRNPAFETWNGKMYSNEEAASISGIESVLDSAERAEFLNAVKEKRTFAAKNGAFETSVVPEQVYMLLPFTETDRGGKREYQSEDEFHSESKTTLKFENARPIFSQLRQIKSPYEIALLQHAIDITTEAQMRSMGIVGKASMEYEVQAEVEYTFRRRNADFWGYPSIVGCGPNATTLHYEESQGQVRKGDLLLMDVGAEYDHYTADVTRTFPVNGKFSKEQADIYNIVYDAQEAAANATRPGTDMAAVSAAAADVIKEGLFRLGLITDKNSEQYRIWYMHGLGHWLGMNVHDVGSYGAPFAAGMIFTNEPGIYIREDALDVLPDTPQNKEFIAKVRPAFEKYKNIGVRIEDDMLVTANGVEWMTKKLPRKLKDIEEFMAKASKEMNYRAAALDPSRTLLQVYAIGTFDGFTNPFDRSGATIRSGVVRSGRNTANADSGHTHNGG